MIAHRYLPLALWAAGLARAGAPAIHDAEESWYEIKGSTAGELRAELDRLGPVDEAGMRRDGLTQWDIRWQLPPTQGHCSTDAVTVTLRLSVVLPRWQAPADASRALVAQWQLFLAALVAHEQAHVDMVQADMPAVRNALASAGCDRIAGVGERAVERLRALHAGYDDATAHGRATGAVFP